ncbi:MAG: hypothetical protein AAF152_08430 [Cyanobacteria bacterium P01_A01_bin.114]
MGWNFCIATESDCEQAKLLNPLESSDEDYELFYAGINSLSRQFSYALAKEGGLLQKGLVENEIEALNSDDIDSPDHWRPRNPRQLMRIFCRAKERLKQENEQMPVDHFLWYVDEQGKRLNGSTQITLPFVGIELKLPHGSIVKLDGGHHNPNHRWELRKYDVHIDADLLAQFHLEIDRYRVENDIELHEGAFSISMPGVSAIDPLVEVPIEWIPVQPVLEVLGYRVEVQSVDALSSFEPELDRAICCCEQAIRMNVHLYWLRE